MLAQAASRGASWLLRPCLAASSVIAHATPPLATVLKPPPGGASWLCAAQPRSLHNSMKAPLASTKALGALSSPVSSQTTTPSTLMGVRGVRTHLAEQMRHRGGSQAILTRYPGTSAGGVLRGMDYFGTCVFAASGSLAAMAAGMDIVGGGIVGLVTAVGGGTVRDVIVGQHPVFWLVETEYLAMAVATAVAVYSLAAVANERWPDGTAAANAFKSFMKWGDAIGVGAFAAIGADCAVVRGLPWYCCILFGLITSTNGGLARDVLCHRPVRILNNNKDMYATVALWSASAYTAAAYFGTPPAARVAAALLTSVSGRYYANDVRDCADEAPGYTCQGCGRQIQRQPYECDDNCLPHHR